MVCSLIEVPKKAEEVLTELGHGKQKSQLKLIFFKSHINVIKVPHT